MAANQATRLQTDLPPLKLKGRRDILETFEKAAETFIHEKEGHIEIWAASQDWFLEEWGRDTFISLPGLLLSTGKTNQAKNNLRHFASYEKAGLLPNRIEKDGNLLYNSSDAPMWFIQAVKKLNDPDFTEEMRPVMTRIIKNYEKGTSFERYGSSQSIDMDASDGLIRTPAQSTWMDADAWGDGSAIVTPRNGKTVEINALWYSNLRFLNEHDLADTVQENFNKKFWNEQENSLFDVLEGDPHQGAIRPNQCFAVSHAEDLLSQERQQAVFDCVTRELLTPGGLRTLSPRDSHYIGHYNTDAPLHEKDPAYHQGTIWPWLIGPYCDMLVKLGHEDQLEATLTPLITFCLESEYHSLPEVFSGDPPHEPGGTRSQAWSIAEVLRILIDNHLIS